MNNGIDVQLDDGAQVSLIEDIFTGLFQILWNPSQPLVMGEAAIVGHLLSASESEVQFFVHFILRSHRLIDGIVRQPFLV